MTLLLYQVKYRSTYSPQQYIYIVSIDQAMLFHSPRDQNVQFVAGQPPRRQVERFGNRHDDLMFYRATVPFKSENVNPGRDASQTENEREALDGVRAGRWAREWGGGHGLLLH